MEKIEVNKTFYKPENKKECMSIKCSNCYILLSRHEPDYCNYKKMERQMWDYKHKEE